jgi:hypothetical protein
MLSLFTVDLAIGGKSMAEEAICVDEKEQEPEQECDAPNEASPGKEDWQEATLMRLEAWIEERERLIDEIERRIAEESNAA